jgi:hypothetical protein
VHVSSNRRIDAESTPGPVFRGTPGAGRSKAAHRRHSGAERPGKNATAARRKGKIRVMLRLNSVFVRTLAGVCLAWSLCSLPPTTAQAAPDAKELSRARAKFQQATELEQAGQYTAAIELFREVGQVRMTAQVRYHIAFCEEKLGRLVAALGGYELAQAQASEVGPTFEKEVAGRIEDLKSRIPKLVIKRGKESRAANIELDGIKLGQSSIGVEMPADPGPHTVIAKAPGYQTFTQTVEVAETDVKEIVVELVKLPEGATGGAGGTGIGDQGVTGDDKPPSKVMPLVIGGIGVASLAASGVFFLMRQGKLNELDDKCPGGNCPNDPSLKDTYDDAKSYNTLSMVTGVVGVVGVGVGVTWLLTQKSPAKTTTGWQLTPAAPRAQAGMSLVGQF